VRPAPLAFGQSTGGGSGAEAPDQRWGSAAGRSHTASAAATDASAKGGRNGALTGRGELPAEETAGVTRLPSTAKAPEPGPVQRTQAPDAATPQGFNAKRSKEIKGERDERERTYFNPDGTYTTRFYTEPVNFRAADGSWKSIDTSLVPRDSTGPSTMIVGAAEMLDLADNEQYSPDAYAKDPSQNSGRTPGTDNDEDEENCTTHLEKTKAERGASGIVCFRAPTGATQDQIDELKDHIAALNAIPNYWSSKGRVSPGRELVMGPNGKAETLSKAATDIKTKHISEVKGTSYEYQAGTVAGNLPDTTWSGQKSPYCWHQQDTKVNSKVGSYATKYNEGYYPTGFYYAGVDGDPGTYPTQRETGAVSPGQYGICQISRP
jgi:hypothetical protein